MIHEAQGRDTRQKCLKRRLRPRSLQRQKRAVGHRLYRHLWHGPNHVGNVRRLARCIHDEIQMIAPVGEHQVIQNTALIVGKEAIALPPLHQSQHIDRHQALEDTRQIIH